MTTIPRRAVVTAIPALTVPATGIAASLLATEPGEKDARVKALFEYVCRKHDEYVESRAAWTRVRERWGMDEWPEDDSEAAYGVWRGKIDRLCKLPEHTAAADASDEAHTALGAAYNALFACSANTLEGVILKFEAFQATRNGEGDADQDLTAFEDPLGNWLVLCRLDLYRLAGAS